MAICSGNTITILESHQATKTSAPGTAINIAHSLNLKTDQIISVRDQVVQENELGIPSDCLSRHAYHRVIIGDGNVSITIETKVLGQAPYASGLAKVIEGICRRELEPKSYDILTLFHKRMDMKSCFSPIPSAKISRLL